MPQPEDLNRFEDRPDRSAADLNQEALELSQVMQEFVEGFDKMAQVHPAVSIFGSSRIKSDHSYYQLTEQIACNLSQRGFSIISGGGPGLMEAANKGAQKAGSSSIGLNIILPDDRQAANQYQDISVDFHYFFVRKMMFIRYSVAYLVMPGGFGSLDELIEVLMLIQTGKTPVIPIILVQSAFWTGLLSFMRNTMVAEGTIDMADLDLMQVLDSPEEICEAIFDFYAQRGFHRPEDFPALR